MDAPLPISRCRAVTEGFTDRELHGPMWRRVHRGAYIRAEQTEGLRVEERHLVLTRAVAEGASREAVVSHVSASVAHGLTHWKVPLARVHLTRDRSTGGRVTPRVTVHSTRTDPDEVVRIGELRVTSVARTVVDLARTVPFEQAVVIGDSALRLGKTTRAELSDQLARATGRPGAPAARRVVDFLDGRSESAGESRSRVAMHAAGLPSPEPQAILESSTGRFIGRVDFLFPELGAIGEFDGLVKYGAALRGSRTPEEVVIAEKAREDELRALGWIVVRWTWNDLDNPASWLTRLTRAATITTPAHRLGTWTPAERI
ncbi:hypothetical protein ABZV58_03835 [Nocardia sp. NPDC004654]|uniref:hypothetical protein n=1 Tax=Nocardia sp. NPDC004654 TaxID=3154776 RepID=UPI0033B4C975